MRLILIKLLLAALLFAFTGSLSTRKQIQHDLTWQCCKKKGGTKMCGNLVQDCCKSECVTKMGFFETCENGKQIEAECSDSCNSVCEGKGGKMCNNGLFGGNLECCKAQECEGYLMKECKAGSKMQLGVCEQDGFFTKGMRFAETIAEDYY